MQIAIYIAIAIISLVVAIILIIFLIRDRRKDKLKVSDYGIGEEYNFNEVNNNPVINDYNDIQMERTVFVSSDCSDDKLIELEKIPKLDDYEKTEVLDCKNLNDISKLKQNDNKLYATLEYYENEEKKQYDICKEFVNIGRANDNDLVIKGDRYIGRNHAIIYLKNYEFFVSDLNTTNGSFLNNEKISGSLKIENGSTLKLGNTEIKVIINN